MHKTLYIDIDEEITSIVDRVRKADAREVIIVAPKNALLLQSTVNLKLLKKETDRRKKQLMIITQDKIGKKLIEKAGILAQSKPPQDIYLEEEPKEEAYQPRHAEEASRIKKDLQEESEVRIGSSDFFETAASPKSEMKQTQISNPEKIRENLPEESAGEGDADGTKEIKSSRIKMSDIIGKSAPKTKKKKKAPSFEEKTEKKPVAENSFSQFHALPENQPSKISRVSMKKAENFFRGSRRIRKDIELARVGRNTKKYFFVFAGAFAALSAAAAAYFLLPEAVLSLETLSREKPVSAEITAAVQSDADSGSNVVSATVEQLTKEKVEEFDSSGTASGEGKASGRVVIYNEFSAENQPLVATTRLQTDDGKIFRITKNIVVPGMTKVGNENKPGAIETEVVADKSGEEYVIGPANFKIPGFEGNPEKYGKIHAKSSKPMEGSATGERKTVTAADITRAKEKISASVKKEAVEELKKNIPSGRKIFDDAVQIEISNLVSSENAGTEKNKFSVKASARATAISFQESDVEEILKNKLAKDGTGANAISFDGSINYILSEADIGQKMLKFEAKTDAQSDSGLDLGNFKKGILGKTVEEAQIYAKNFPAIQKMDISLWPFFAKRIPLREGRVEIEVK